MTPVPILAPIAHAASVASSVYDARLHGSSSLFAIRYCHLAGSVPRCDAGKRLMNLAAFYPEAAGMSVALNEAGGLGGRSTW
jgi:hypothetical protein